MSCNKQKVIGIAISQLGYHEKASNCHLDSHTSNAGNANWTKYARDLDKLPSFYNAPTQEMPIPRSSTRTAGGNYNAV